MDAIMLPGYGSAAKITVPHKTPNPEFWFFSVYVMAGMGGSRSVIGNVSFFRWRPGQTYWVMTALKCPFKNHKVNIKTKQVVAVTIQCRFTSMLFKLRLKVWDSMISVHVVTWLICPVLINHGSNTSKVGRVKRKTRLEQTLMVYKHSFAVKGPGPVYEIFPTSYQPGCETIRSYNICN